MTKETLIPHRVWTDAEIKILISYSPLPVIRYVPGVEPEYEADITPAMIDAGIKAYLECDREYDSCRQIVCHVFQAMIDES